MTSLHFHVCFAIKVLGLHIANSFGVACMQDNKVAWNVLVVFDLDDVSWLDILPLGVIKPLPGLIELDGLLLVFSLVALVSFEVLEGILEHGHNHHTRQWGSLDWLAIGYGD